MSEQTPRTIQEGLREVAGLAMDRGDLLTIDSTLKEAAAAIRDLQANLEAERSKSLIRQANCILNHDMPCKGLKAAHQKYLESEETVRQTEQLLDDERKAHDATELRLEQTVAQMNHERNAREKVEHSLAWSAVQLGEQIKRAAAAEKRVKELEVKYESK